MESRFALRSFYLLSTRVLLVFSLSGCASYFDPYVDLDRLKKGDQTFCNRPATDFDQVLECAWALESEYTQRMGDQAILSSVSGVGLMALTAYTAGIAINDGHGTNVTDFALGTAALFGMSQWLSQPERTRVFGLGVKALACAQSATLPFQAHSSNIGDFRTDVETLKTAIRSLEKATGDLATDIGRGENGPKGREAHKEAKALLAKANNVVSQGVQLIQTYERAPAQLMLGIRGINAAVSIGLSDTVQSMSSLPGALNGVLAIYGSFHTGLGKYGFSPSTEPDTPPEENQSIAAGELDIANVKSSYEVVHKAMAAVELSLMVYTPDLPAVVLESCGDGLANLPSSLMVEPATLEFGDVTAAMQSIHIQGGSGKYVYDVDTTALDIEQVPAFGEVLQIKPADNAAPGHYLVIIRDTSQKSEVVSVTIGDK